jgi:hypothetical protein
MSTRRCLLNVTVTCVAILLFARPSSAAVIPVSEAGFTAPTTIGFTTEGTWDATTPYSELGATFSTPEFFFYTTDHGSIGDNILDLWAIAGNGSSLDVSFDGTVSRFGFHAGTNIASHPPLGDGMADYLVTSVEFYSDAAFTNLIDTYAAPTLMSENGQTFYGLASSAVFQSIRINISSTGTGGGFSPYMDDFLYDSGAAAIPEPALLSLLGAGIAGIVLSRRRAAR